VGKLEDMPRFVCVYRVFPSYAIRDRDSVCKKNCPGVFYEMPQDRPGCEIARIEDLFNMYDHLVLGIKLRSLGVNV